MVVEFPISLAHTADKDMKKQKMNSIKESLFFMLSILQVTINILNYMYIFTYHRIVD